MASAGSGMAASQSSLSGTASNSVEVDGAGEEVGSIINPKYPFWKYATKLSADPSGRGGNTCFRCHFCMNDFPGSYTRIRAHLLKILNAGINSCTKMTQPLFEELRKEDKAAALLISHGKTRNTLPLPPFEDSGPSASSRKRKAAGKQSGILDSFHLELRQQADALIARMFITGGVPFNLARNPYYRESYNFIAKNELGGYVPPGYNALRTTCLAKEKKHVGRMLEPIMSTWPLKGVTIATDGWADPQRRPILNFMAVTEWSNVSKGDQH